MKQLILCASMMLTLTTLAQWETEYYVDDFGEPTGETFEYFDELGVFSNSATTNSECAYFVKHDKNSENFSISIYPYNSKSKESWISSTFQEAKIKNPSGDVVIVKAFCYKKGQVIFSDEDYPIFRDAISDVGDYTFLMKYEGKYSASTYKFKFTIK
jgi:hypothetical protein